MLCVKCGPFHRELEEAFIARLRDLVSRHPSGPLAVVAPSRRLADRLQRLAAVEHGMALLGVHFHTFHSLALGVVEDSGFPAKRLIGDPVFHDKLIDRLLEENRAIAALFGGPARPRALAGALRSSLRDLIDAGVSGPSIEEHFGTELLREPHERERLSALLFLVEAYGKRLEELGVLSPSGLTRLAAQSTENSAYLRRFKEVLYYGFYDLTGLQLDFFEQIVSRYTATLFFPYRRGHPAFRFAEALFEEKLMGHEVEELDAGEGETALGKPVLDRLFSASAPGRAAGSAEPLARLALYNASGSRDEVWAAAKEMLRLVEGGECRYEDIGLVARTLEPYRARVAEVFRENAIPFEMSAPEPLLRHPLAKGAFNLLSLRRRDFPAAVVEDLFSSPYFRGGEGFGPRRLFHWRELIRHLGIHAGWLQWRGKLEGRLKEDLQLYPEEAREGGLGYLIPKEDVRALWELVSGWERELREAGSWSDSARRSRGILERALKLPDRPSQAEEAALAAVHEAVESLSIFDLLGGAPSQEEFLDALEEKLKRAGLEAGSGMRGVRVLDAMEARGESFSFLFLIGLKDKLFPRQILEDPLLRDAARSALRHPAGYWIGRKAAGYEEERLLFYLMVSSARERLYCVYPRSDEAGKAEVPSLYLRELCRTAGLSMADEDFNRRVSRQPAGKLKAWPVELLSPKEISLRMTIEGHSAGKYLSSVGREGELLESCLARLTPLNSWGKPGPMDGLMGPPREYLEELLESGLSPSALDGFARCPFQFFAQRVLGLGRRDEAARQGEFAAWTRGRIYHSVLERFYAGLGEDFWKDPEASWAKKLDGAIQEVFEEFGWREMGVYPVLWLSAKETMTAFLRDFVAWDMAEIKRSGLKPVWFEKRLRAPLPGSLPAALRGLEMHGVIDRVDLDASGRYRIVDYKTRVRSRAKISTRVSQGEMHQLPIYAELAGRDLGGAGTLESACLYALEDSPETTGLARAHGYEGRQWAEDRGGFFERVSACVEEMARGRFPIRPQDGEFGYCGYCDFSAVCRKSHGPSRRRAEAGREASAAA